MFALSEKSAEKKTKTARLPIAHYKQKPAGSDLWPVNRCIPNTHKKMRIYVRVVKWGRFKCNSYKSLNRTSCKGNRKNTNTRFSRVVCLLNACIVGRPERRPEINVICLVLTSVM